MTPMQQIAARAPLELEFGKDRKTLELYNIERVRSFMEHHFGCLSMTQIALALNLNRRTVSKAVRIIRSRS